MQETVKLNIITMVSSTVALDIVASSYISYRSTVISDSHIFFKQQKQLHNDSHKNDWIVTWPPFYHTYLAITHQKLAKWQANHFCKSLDNPLLSLLWSQSYISPYYLVALLFFLDYYFLTYNKFYMLLLSIVGYCI